VPTAPSCVPPQLVDQTRGVRGGRALDARAARVPARLVGLRGLGREPGSATAPCRAWEGGALELTGRAGQGRKPAILKLGPAAIAGAHRAAVASWGRGRVRRAGGDSGASWASRQSRVLMGQLRAMGSRAAESCRVRATGRYSWWGSRGAFRRSELAGLGGEDLEWTEEGLKSD
jgi:hypothetical protein